jgi:radical SAM protein with 4Fe4S-binding SPASM domain
MRKTFYKFLNRGIARYFKVPQFLIFYLTNKCWMKCDHCFYTEEFRLKNNIDSDIMSFEEIKLISNSIKKILYLSFTGGEPFIRDDLNDIINLFTKTKKTSRFQIPTSGFNTSLILEKTERILEENPKIPFRIHVSLDGNEDIHDKIRLKCNSFKNAVNTILELSKFKKHYPCFDVSVITTICKYNENILEEIGQIAEKANPNGEWCVNLIRGKSRNLALKDFEIRNYNKIIDAINKQRNKTDTYTGYSGHFSSKWLTAKNAARRKIIIDILKNDYAGGGCSAGSIGGVVFPDGSVYPCELLNKSFGNLRDYNYNFNLLWNSQKADSIRNWIQDNDCLCTHECNLSANFLIQPRTWPLLIFERIKLFKKDNSSVKR